MIKWPEECEAEREICDAVDDIVGNTCHPPCESHIDAADKKIWDRAECAEEQAIKA